jgi:amino acid transporter
LRSRTGKWGSLLVFSGLAIYYRLHNPQGTTAWTFSGAWDAVKPHTLNGVLIQSTIAILILVGFESSTSLSAETKNAKTTIPKAIIISLVVQGLLAYLIEYFATGTMISIALTVVIAVIGTTLSCMNTAMRISGGMAAGRKHGLRIPLRIIDVHEVIRKVTQRARPCT